MSKRTRMVLVLIGLAAMLVGIALLAAALVPGTTLHIQVTLVPTLLAPPQVLP